MKKLALIAAAGILMAGSAHAQVAGRGHPGGGNPGGGHTPGPRPGGGHGGGWNGGWGHGGGWNGGWNQGGWSNGSFFGGFGFGGFWQQPQYHVQNWQLYGFIDPGPQRQWIRYYDDAYLVDGRGYVHDSRRRLDWDRYGERWARDGQGIPYYAGRGDYRPGRGEHARVERERRQGYDCRGMYACGAGYDRYDYDGRGVRRDDRYDRDARYDRDERYGERDGRYDRDERYEYDRDGRRVNVIVRREGGQGGYDARYDGAYARDGYSYGSGAYGVSGSGAYGHGGYGAGYGGYGYGGNGTVIVTETTITPGETIVTEEIIEEVIEERAVRHRAAPRRQAVRRPAPRPRAPAPAPAPRRVYQPSGERG